MILTNLGKSRFLFLINICFFALMASCKKPDTEAPVVTVTGDANPVVSLQGTYTELGATATDNVDGASITPTVSGMVNTALAGVYEIKYRAIDAAGNIGDAIRTVTVRNDAYKLAGNYLVNAGLPGEYAQVVTASDTANNKLFFSRFGNYKYNSFIYAIVSETSLTIPKQMAIQVGEPAADRTFMGTGTADAQGVVSLVFTDSANAVVNSVTETFTKQ